MKTRLFVTLASLLALVAVFSFILLGSMEPTNVVAAYTIYDNGFSDDQPACKWIEHTNSSLPSGFCGGVVFFDDGWVSKWHDFSVSPSIIRVELDDNDIGGWTYYVDVRHKSSGKWYGCWTNSQDTCDFLQPGGEYDAIRIIAKSDVPYPPYVGGATHLELYTWRPLPGAP